MALKGQGAKEESRRELETVNTTLGEDSFCGRRRREEGAGVAVILNRAVGPPAIAGGTDRIPQVNKNRSVL